AGIPPPPRPADLPRSGIEAAANPARRYPTPERPGSPLRLPPAGLQPSSTPPAPYPTSPPNEIAGGTGAAVRPREIVASFVNPRENERNNRHNVDVTSTPHVSPIA